jgi:hypothetical protein
MPNINFKISIGDNPDNRYSQSFFIAFLKKPSQLNSSLNKAKTTAITLQQKIHTVILTCLEQ